MNDIIIHISDLHVTDTSGTFGSISKETSLTTEAQDTNFALIESFVNKIKEHQCANRYLVISGDITNIVEEEEFEIAKKLLEKVMSDLDIKKENILLVPVDHEIHRTSILTALKEKENIGKKGYLLNNDKYKYFLPFYKEIKGIEFDTNKLIFDQIEIGDILLLAVNSNYKVGQNSDDGFLPLEQFDKELTQIVSKNKSKHIVLVVHHNISGTFQDKRTGQWVKENRQNLIPLFLKHQVKMILHGNEHTPKSETLDSSKIYVSDSGALAGKDPLGSFKIYEIVSSASSIKLSNNLFQLRKTNAVIEPTAGDWMTLSPKEATTEIESFDIYTGKPESIIETIELPSLQESKDIGLVEQKESTESSIVYVNEMIQSNLYQIIKDKKLFHSGHFHWSESSRAHNWIDIAKLLENHDDLYFVKKAIVDVIESQSLNDDCDLMVGLGAEGNIISSKASIQFEMPHVSLPYSYRYDESHEYERQINYDNSRGNFKTVMIISDVINDGRTLRKLIGFHEKEFFEKVERVIVISLFYTGQESINTNILNYDNLSEKHNIEDEYKINCIEFYAIKQLRVEKCPYGSDYKEECFIYKDDLNCVHLFFNEDTEVDVT